MHPLVLAAAAVGGFYLYKHPELLPKKLAVGAERSSTRLNARGLNPARERVMVQLLEEVHSPARLDKAAQLFAQHGASKAAQALSAKAKQVRAQTVVAGELVEQARAGDQNAIGTIASIRDAAKAGSPRAQVSIALLTRYVDKNPPPDVKVEDPELHAGAYAAGVAPPPEQQPSETPQSFEGVE